MQPNEPSSAAPPVPAKGRWRRRLGVAALLLVGAAVVAGGLLVGRPGWYTARVTDPAVIDAGARRVEDKLVEARNWAAAVAAKEARDRKGATSSRRPVGEEPSAEFELTFTAEELTSFLLKWTRVQGWEEQYRHYVTDPAVGVEAGGLTVAGRVTGMPVVMSIRLRPELAGETLKLRLAAVRGGRLPLPTSVATSQLARLDGPISRSLDRWKRDARLDDRGLANTALALATSGRLLLAGVRDTPTDAVLALPVDERRSVLVRLTDVSTGPEGVRLKARPLTPDERAAWLRAVKQ